jgi:hypothetical protein
MGKIEMIWRFGIQHGGNDFVEDGAYTIKVILLKMMLVAQRKYVHGIKPNFLGIENLEGLRL